MALWPKNAPGYIRQGQAYYRQIGGKFNIITRAHWRDEPCKIEREEKDGHVVVTLGNGDLVLVDKAAVQVL